MFNISCHVNIMRALHRDKKTRIQDKDIVRTQCSKLHKMKLTLEKTISPTKPWYIGYKLWTQKMPHPLFDMEKEGGGKSLETTINQGIATRKSTKKNLTCLLYLRRWAEQWIIISKVQYFTLINISMNTTCSSGNEVRPPFSCFAIELGIIFPCFIIKMVFCKLTSILWTSTVDLLDLLLTSTFVYICSWIISVRTNGAKFSTPTCICCPIACTSTFLSFTTPWTPSASLLSFLWIYIYKKTQTPLLIFLHF